MFSFGVFPPKMWELKKKCEYFMNKIMPVTFWYYEGLVLFEWSKEKMKFLMNEVISALDCRFYGVCVGSFIACSLVVCKHDYFCSFWLLCSFFSHFKMLWPCIASTSLNKSFSFQIMVVVNVYKLYSTCIKLPSCIRILCKSFHYFFKGLIQNGWIDIIWSWHSVHALK